MELMNTINTNASASNSIFDLLDKELAQQDEQFKGVEEMRAKTAEIKRNILEHDTVFYVDVASRGYISVSSATLEGAFTAPVVARPQMPAGVRITNPQAVMYAFCATLKQANQSNKNHVAVYMNEDEARRVSGMIKRIREQGAQAEPLTAKEIEKIESTAKYGEFYKAACLNAFNMLKALMQTKKVRVMGIDTISAYPLSKGANLIDLAGKSFDFKNGQARFYDEKRIAHTLEVRGFKMNGTHKLVIDNDRLAVERILTKESDPEKCLAQSLFRVTSRAVTIQESKDRYEYAVESFGAEESEDQAVA